MTDTCVFCGSTGTDFKSEHWVPQWVSRGAIPKGKGILHNVPGRDPWPSKIVDLTVRHVCSECNHHWMSDMESRIRDVALPLTRGEHASLSEPDVQRLAAWGFLKAITLELGRPNEHTPTYPPAIYSGFRVIDVIGVLASATVKVEDRDDRLIEIWPEGRTLDWPPAKPFVGIVNNDLA